MMLRRFVILLLVLGLGYGCAERRQDKMTPPSSPPPAAKIHAPKVLPRPAPTPPDAKTSPKPPAEEPAPLLVPVIADENKDRVESEVSARIQQTELLVAQINLQYLTAQQNETFSAIQSFLAKAKEALQERDMPRALNLAEKAHALAQDLPTGSTK